MQANFLTLDFLSLPQEVQLHVFSFLTPKELSVNSLVSKTFYMLSIDNSLWNAAGLNNKAIQEMFPAIPKKDPSNHFHQFGSNSVYLKTEQPKTIQRKMNEAAEMNNLEHVKALCNQGFRPSPFTLNAAVRGVVVSNSFETVRFIMKNFSGKIEKEMTDDIFKGKMEDMAVWNANKKAYDLANKIIHSDCFSEVNIFVEVYKIISRLKQKQIKDLEY